jgi:CxxC-x17-CxxC domain-containing protein
LTFEKNNNRFISRNAQNHFIVSISNDYLLNIIRLEVSRVSFCRKSGFKPHKRASREEVMAHFEPTENSQSEFQDSEIICIDCGNVFIWTQGEQQFFYDKGLKNPPKRCKSCKQAKNDRIAAVTVAQTSGIKQKIEVKVNCTKCNVQTTVPFYPSQGRPVYCRSCFLSMNPEIIK